ncbi:hypothetical protein JAAARDRAFT_70242 [Jaapia argillacea MUCL 33604]|uniref:G-protein coupled receptors family 2 profile 2 domain-containing protein n=1 Tax=Jaapia argillacea MUCL 33604 TaxID=933084 RepID=A0A067PRD9_9AGAM|nr:hypothetical protein JAAARDRAFT_70242 [Jaapia argillacea MUCL 33604]
MGQAPETPQDDLPAIAFTLTDQMVAIAVWTAVGPSIAAFVLAAVVLILAILLYRRTATRRTLQRHSFVMLMAVLAMSLLNNASFILEVLLTGPTPWCSISVVVNISASNCWHPSQMKPTLNEISGLFMEFVVMLIAINLQLVFVHRLITRGWVKWYLVGSLVASVVIVIPSVASGVWGWDVLTGGCYTAIRDPHRRLVWHMTAIYGWVILATFVAIVSTLVVLGTLFFHSFHRRKVLSITQITHNTVFDDAARSVAWRISLYPCIMIFVGGISAASDLLIDTSGGIMTYSSFVLWCVYGVVSGLPPVLFALLAITVDPSLTAALRLTIKSFKSIDGFNATGLASSSPVTFASTFPNAYELQVTTPQNSHPTSGAVTTSPGICVQSHADNFSKREAHGNETNLNDQQPGDQPEGQQPTVAVLMMAMEGSLELM